MAVDCPDPSPEIMPRTCTHHTLTEKADKHHSDIQIFQQHICALESLWGSKHAVIKGLVDYQIQTAVTHWGWTCKIRVTHVCALMLYHEIWVKEDNIDVRKNNYQLILEKKRVNFGALEKSTLSTSGWENCVHCNLKIILNPFAYFSIQEAQNGMVFV